MQGVFQPPVKFQYQKEEKNSRFWAVKNAPCILNKIGIGLHQSYDDPDFEQQIVVFIFTDNLKRYRFVVSVGLPILPLEKLTRKQISHPFQLLSLLHCTGWPVLPVLPARSCTTHRLD